MGRTRIILGFSLYIGVAQLACPNCRRSYPLELPSSTCPICGGWLRVSYDYHAIREGLSREVVKARGFNAWRYLEVLPAKPEWRVVSLGEGWDLHPSRQKAG
jgi:threonine synthase